MLNETSFFFFIAIHNLKKLLTAFSLTLTSWVCTLVAVLMVAMFVSVIGRALSWYTHFYVSVSLYGTAAAAKLILVHMLAKKFFYKVGKTLLLLLKGNEVFNLWETCLLSWLKKKSKRFPVFKMLNVAVKKSLHLNIAIVLLNRRGRSCVI